MSGFKAAIAPIPSASDFLDIVLSRTQRKLPTQVRPGFKITRIRNFYSRKVRFTQDTFTEKLEAILTEFPKLNDVHPFHADLLNILYDRDHLKIALSQLSTAKHLIQGVGRDYVRLLKYADSLYRCKQLKRAALGRMATIMKRQKSGLEFLEQVRQHMSRLPGIDPNTRTLLICGYPNVGKSSFMNKVTRAQVDVQPYAFTTKSLFVGHMDYKYLRWQVIDTPGILDHPLEEMNTIEMQSITAMAHLRSAVLYFMDLSEQCGYTIEAQVKLYHSIKPLFANKLTFLVINKIDQMRPEDLDERNAALLRTITDSQEAGGKVRMLQTSCFTDQGVMQVKQAACDALLASRVENKLKGTRINDVLNRIHLAQPHARDAVERPAFVPEGVAGRVAYDRQDPNRRRLARDVEEEEGGAGVYNVNLREQYLLENPEWKHDKIPELYNGKNVADFIDPDIDAKLAALEAEEEQLQAEGFYDSDEEIVGDEEAELLSRAREIRDKKDLQRQAHRKRKAMKNRAVIPRTAGLKTFSQMQTSLAEAGLDVSAVEERGGRARSRDRERDRAAAEAAVAAADSGMDVDSLPSRSKSRARSQSNRREDGIHNEEARDHAERVARLKQRQRNRMAKASESDRRVQSKMPKHLFTGKRPGFHTARSR